MNDSIPFVAVAISTGAGIVFGIWLARAVRRSEHRRTADQNRDAYRVYALPPPEPATGGREDESERKAA